MSDGLLGNGAPADGVAMGNTTSTGWRLHYFNAPSRGEQLRLLFKLGRTPFEDVRFAFPKGLLPFKHAAMGDESPLMYDQCPMITSPEGHHISQTAACMQYLGRRLDLAPADHAADARALSLVLYAEEMRITIFYPLLYPIVINLILAKRFFGILGCLRSVVNMWFRFSKARAALHPMMKLLESALRTGGGDYFCGSRVCYADVALFDLLREILAMPCFDAAEQLRTFPKLREFLARMEELPELREYLEQRDYACQVLGQGWAAKYT
eukprot:NODE_16090_length_1012_cov_31.058757.p2 GENE.NODE_16090_length_1012_cov_31.058757~~NODE_16090_length_1012_cov_31.058757.p2  ORF type:complete len:267 (-),score=57.26 NODE_16090_length_1012_cov_31.058757:108-908(-)